MAGKTTSYPDALHTDDLMPGRTWSEQSQAAAELFNRKGDDLTVEGITVPRALRKWLAEHPTGKPVDEVVVMMKPLSRLTDAQSRLATGVATVMAEIEPELVRRGVRIERK